ncbi:MAG TPA: UPF0182 family protein [Acidimicrobiales bacterium]|nr:UPF0182 family protein [Acidimicrobiales bacterium]
MLIVALVALFFLLTSLRGIAGFYTDYLWYDSLGLWSVQRGILGAQLSLALIFIAAFFLLAWSNLYVTEVVAPPFRPAGPEDELLERYHDLVAGRMTRVRTIVAGLLALIAGSGASAEWNSWLLFTNGGEFGVKDPQFNRDVGFYVFKLPFMSFVVDWLFASLLIVLIVSAVAHYLNGGIRVQPPSPRVSPQVKAHLSVLLAALALVKTADYYLQRFELTASTRGVVDGASYTDVHAQLPALNLLVLISVAAAALFVGNIFRRGWALPLVAVVLWGFVAIVVGGIYPQFVQWRTVTPNVLAKEETYIDRNITATRDAMGLGEVTSNPFDPKDDAADVNLVDSASTIRNIRLWDPANNISGEAFSQLQQIRDYYRIGDIDVDRYAVDGQPTQVNLGIRNLQPGNVPGNSWEQSHLAYTHGYGAVMAPSNATQDGEPDFLMRDIPVQSDVEGLTLSDQGAGVYIGEDLSGYSVVDTGRDEVDYQAEEGTQTTTYEGEDGVGVGSFVRKAAFALRFGDINPLLSSYLTGDSKVIYIRDVVDRVHALAPFLHADADPYPVVLDGKVTWVVDLYTTTDRYPYAQRAETDQLADASDLDHRFNYVRNSVKATVDAYDGTVTFYVMDTDDPIIDAYRKAFPELFTDGDEMPGDLESHLRYPEDLFRVQTTAWGRYHLENPREWYDAGDAWQVAADPGTNVIRVNSTTDTTAAGSSASTSTSTSSADPIPPYYQLLQLPEEQDAEFVLMRPFVPAARESSRQQLTAFMVARMDPGHYGELGVYTMPQGNLPEGPSLVRAAMRADETVADEESLLGVRTGGSRVIYGNLMMVPVDGSLLYVQPLYVESESAGRIPRLTKVILMLDDDVVIENTLQEALTTMFGEAVPTQETGDPTQPEEPSEGEGEGGGEAPSGSAAEQAAQLLDEANQLFDDAGAALEDQDLARYGDLQEQAEEKVAEASEILGAGGSGSSPATTTTTAPASDESAAGADADVLDTFDAPASSSPTTTTTTEPPEPLARGA